MNYRVLLRVQVQKDNWITLGEDHIVTWEIRDLIEASSGWSVLNQESIGIASSLIPKLEKGVLELTQHTSSYSSYEIAHGVGTIQEVLGFYQSLLKACQDHPFTELYGNIID